jgi:hypothetical protein
MSCTDPIAPEHLDLCPTDELLPGVSETEVYVSLLKDFDTVAAVPAYADGADLSGLGTITEAHTFLDNNGFHKLTLRVDTGMGDGAQAGEKGSLALQNNLTGVIPSTGAAVTGWIRKHLNRPMIVIFTERDGTMKQLGSKFSPAYMLEITPTSGQKAGDAKGTTVKFTDTQLHPAPVYEGTITEFSTGV